MIKMTSKVRLLLHASALVLLCTFPGPANGGLIIDGWKLTETSLDFRLFGTIDVVGGMGQGSLFIGPRNSTSVDWILPGSGAVTLYSAWITQNGGTYAADQYSAAYDNPNFGDYIYTNNSTDLFVGQHVDLNFAITGHFDPAALNVKDLIVSAGFEWGFANIPDERFVTGKISSPGSIGLVLLGLVSISRARYGKQGTQR